MVNLDTKIESITKKLNEIDTENKTQIAKIPILESQNESLSDDKQRLEGEKRELSENLRNEKSQNDQLKSEKIGLTQQIADLEGKNTDLNSKNQDLNSKLTDEKRKNDKLNKDINTDLFNLYKHLPADFRQNFSFIKADTQMKFIITSGDKTTLINLYEHIKNEAKNNKDISQLSGFFDELFEVQRDIYDLERIEASSEFDESNHIDLGGKSRGKIEKTIFKGFKDGKKPYKSVVKIGE